MIDQDFTLPPEAYGLLDGNSQTIPLEFLHWPLFSTLAIDNAVAIPRQLDFFQYAVGSTVAGTGGGAITATAWHTNMQLANALPRPKTFTCVGVRLFVIPLDFTGGNPALKDDTVGVAVENNDQVDDITFLLQTSWFQFRQGEIEEVACPAFLLPCNTGIDGLVGSSVSNTNTASLWQTRVSTHGVGVGYSIKRRPFVLWNQQFFSARLFNEWATNPTLADDTYIRVVLDGIMGRELQG